MAIEPVSEPGGGDHREGAASASMNPMRSTGCAGSMGRYAARSLTPPGSR
ncbi:hypothetical protein I552_3675 [Mycobacterium xenopi 3993]|nr:hypothetical protein I552_3675 [Mycobacterium xenopi 3993]